MQLLFTTENYFFRAELNASMTFKEIEIIDKGGPHHNFWGITWDRREGLLYNVRTTDKDTHFIEVRDLKNIKKVLGRIDYENFSFCHNILFVERTNTLYVTNTHRGEVLCFNYGGLSDVISFPGVCAQYKAHTNSLYYKKGFLYVGHHNKGDSSICKYNVLEKQTDKVVYLGRHIHDIWFEDEAITTCSSREATIKALHLGISRTLCECQGYPRGVAVNGSYRFVGHSVFTATDGLPDPRHLIDPIEHARIVVYDKWYNELNHFDLSEFDAKQVFCVRLLDVPDYAHKD